LGPPRFEAGTATADAGIAEAAAATLGVLAAFVAGFANAFPRVIGTIVAGAAEAWGGELNGFTADVGAA
jgi:hypothetical protein